MELNCLGMRCPIPIIKLAAALKEQDEIILLSDDPATFPDLTAWVRMTGNEFSVTGLNQYLVKKL